MVNIIITSEMRVGSRWLHYLLRDLLGMKVSGELDVREIPACQELIEQRFKENRIVKFHHAKPKDVFKLKGDFKVIAIVRNPRDRMVSWTFHQRFKPSGQGLKEIKEAKTDKEAVKICVNSKIAKIHNTDQLALMMEAFSTKMFHEKIHGKYIWTSYEWMLEDLVGEIETIVKFLGLNIPRSKIISVCGDHKFETRSGRLPGQEVRKNEWFRKGVNDDYKNWFDERMILLTEHIDYLYWKNIRNELEGRKNIQKTT